MPQRWISTSKHVYANQLIKPIVHPKWLSNIVPIKKKIDKYVVVLTSGILMKHAPKMNFHFQT